MTTNNQGFAHTLSEISELSAEIDRELEAELAALEKAPAVPQVNSMDDLDALLNESVALSKGKGSGKVLREQLARAKDRTEALEIEAKLREWESTYEWETLANCALFRQQVCACGSTHTHFAGMYYHQQHHTDPHAQRWVAAWQNLGGESVLASKASVPNRTMVEKKLIPMCPDCAEGAGFSLTGAVEPWKD